ncbi:NAD(P)/FAD-dependent oxidoreductase [Microbacterium sp. RD1]|uniref:NAD(P)/FAD-dependent oxidoreductase n=1 Tax=Microbacterium sp. RD1 TaxID=3457313 RepID=UPI003FA53176
MTDARVLVIGGGNAGLSIAGRLHRKGVGEVTVVEPRDTHIFAPLQSHVAGGVARASEAVRPQREVTPPGVSWIQDAATDVRPQEHRVVLASGRTLEYDQLVVCPGIQMNWDAVPGLAEAMQTPFGVSNYDLALAAKASPLLRDVREGTVVFVQAAGPSSCAGAAQKPMYLACDWWRAQGLLDSIRVVLVLPEPTLHGIAGIDAELQRSVAKYGIEVRYDAHLLAVDPDARTVTIGDDDSAETLAYDVLHAAPPQSAPAWLAATPLAAPASSGGWVEVDPETFQHRRFPDVWALGDAADTDSYKSGGGLRSQAKVLVKNLLAALDGRDPVARYDGYGVCPYTVSRHTVVFAEFDRDGRLEPTVPFWRTLYRERRLSWLFDRRILPWVYWHLILRGRA